MELGAVVDGDCRHTPASVVDELDGAAVRGGYSAVLEFADEDVACLAIDERENAVAVLGTHDGVAFEVSDATPVQSAGWPLGE